ncbi:MAG: SUMF1/EgtB/PvdO family nonheme iron enzyme [Calothrix sp. CSU_2_0]|nr:SUMF1/EgtB/PvdO family nonheme iron enzyme [Calothrix sp. CSU_2_0]
MHIGQILQNRYRIIKIIGSGGFGDTYLAEDINLPNHPKCVVKQLKYNPNPGILEVAKRLFENEAQVLYRLGNESDQIPKLFAHFEDNGEFYLVQEFVDGQDLSREIYPGKQWSEAEVTQLLQEILEVFTVIHNKNIIHRDIKPANLMRRHKDGKIVVIDFGAVKEIGTLMMSPQGQTIPSVAIGTPGYMPSEQSNGQPKLSSDIHAIGVLGIYALTGIQPHELPKDPKTGDIIWQNWANVNGKMADVLTKMVRYHFNDRYQSAFDAMDAVTALKPKPKPQSQSQPDSKQRREILKTLGWLGTGVGLSFLGGKIFMRDTQEPQKSDIGEITNSGTRDSLPTSTSSPVSKTATKSNFSLQTLNFETVTVDSKGTINNRRKLNAKYLAEDLGNGVTLDMVQIPGGTFTMGSPESEVGRSKDESPQRQVQVPSFFMGRYTVTQAQYQAIMGNNPASFKGANRPVEQVSWDDGVEFCKKISQQTGRNYRLPSEAEWEYACRAGTTTPFYFGETITTDLVNYNGTVTPYGSAPKGVYRKETTEVGKFPPNAFGLCDMHGNVWEWCQDVWNDNYSQAPTDGSARLSGNDNQRKLLRGGSWSSYPENCRSAYRFNDTRVNRFIYNGFRVVLFSA